MQSGLWSRSGPVSLVDVSIKGRIVDFTGEVVVRQKYCNKEQNSVDAIFKFPLELFGALSGFEIVVGGKHIVAEVKNRAETNFQLSVRDDDVDDEEDDTSFLSTDDQPDVFLCNIGFLEPGQEVEFIVTYTTVLALVGDSLRFVIPSSTFSLKDEYEGAENETSPRKKLEISSEHNLLISLDVEMPSEIQKIESPTHTVAAEQSGNKATVSFTKGSVTQEGNFVLLIKFQKPHSPYCFVQYDPKTDTKAVMLSFFPEFSLKALASCEIIFLVDCSSSMAGSQLESVKSALQLLLRSLPAKAYFNIVLFGTTFQKVFPSSVPYDNQSLETASKYVDEMDADLGGTEIYEPLAEVLSSPMVNNLPRQLFIITDGQVSNSKKIFNLISKHSHNTRVFTFGIGDRVSHHLVNGMARAGCGEAEFVTGSESLDLKIMRQLKRALQPALTNVHLDWGTFQNVVQAPRKLRTIFNGDRLLVYAFLPKDTSGEATVALKATASEGPVSFQVTLNANNYKTGNLIPILAARARIRDLEENDDDDEEFIRNEVVKLGTTYGLASSYTSFVAYIPVPEKKLSTDSIKRGFNLHSSMEMPVPSEKLSGETQPTIVKPKPILSVQVPVDVPDRSASVSPAPSSPAALGGSGKKIYTPDFLLRFRDLCTEMPSGLVPMDVILGGGRGKNEQSGKSPKGKGGGRGGKGHKRQQSSGGGRNNQKPKTPQSLPPNPLLDKPLVQSENRWTRPTVEQLSELEQKSRRIQGILNKLTVEKFVSLSSNLLEVGVTNPLILEELIKLVYTKAVAEPHFATLYAVLCKRLSEECPSFQDADGKPINFRRLLLNRCQTEFEKKAPPALDDKVDQLEREEVEFKFKRKVLGNIKFIGELFKEGMLPERVMHECLKMLLKDAEEASEDDIESLCKLITTIGKDLELPAYKLRDQVQVYFEKMEALSKSEKLPSRFRFMLKDVIELRQNNWVPRIKKNEAKTLAAARAEIMEQEEEQQAPPPKSPLRRSESKETVRSQDVRDQAAPSPGGRGRGSLPRSASETAIGSESWEVVGGRGKAKGKQGWEVKSPGKPSGRGRGGYSPVADRYAKKPVEEKPKETYKPKGNIFSALGNEEQSNAPKSAMRSGKSASKAVTIQEPEPVKAEMSAEALANKIEMLIEEYLASADLTEAAACVEEVNTALPEVVTKGVQLAFDKKERDRQEILKLFEYLFTEGTIKGQDFEAGLVGVLSTIEEIDIDNPNASKFVGTFIGHFLGGAVQPAFLEREFGHLVDSGKAAQITALALQTVLKNKGESDLLDLYQGKINLLSLLPKDSRDKDNVSKFLLKHGLEGLEASIDGSDDNSDEGKPSPSNNNNGATRGRSGSVSLTLETVIKKQCADGHWNLNSELESFRIGSLDAIKAAIPSYINNNESAWATSLALQLLEIRFDASTDKWELLAEKGMDWLEEQVPDHIDQLQKDAQEFLKGRGL